MKLIIANSDLSAPFISLIRMTFDICNEKLGLTDNPTKVLLRYERDPEVTMSQTGLVLTRGSTESGADADGYIRVAIARDSVVKKVMETLCHEMVHVKQFVLGELVKTYAFDDDGNPCGYSSVTWHGTDYTSETNHIAHQSSAVRTNYLSYAALPWEVEAREISERLIEAVEAEFKVKFANSSFAESWDTPCDCPNCTAARAHRGKPISIRNLDKTLQELIGEVVSGVKGELETSDS